MQVAALIRAVKVLPRSGAVVVRMDSRKLADCDGTKARWKRGTSGNDLRD